jgi:hypothetical protein
MTQEGIRSELGDQQMYALEMDIRRQEDILRKGGKDPHLVYDPRSEQFFGRPENLDKYKVSLQQIQQYRDAVRKGQPAAGILPAAPPKPPAGMPDDAFQGRDNKWYVERNGKIYPIVLKGAGAPKVPMSE